MISSAMSSRCPHVITIGDYLKEDIIKKQEISKCDSCDCQGPNLWVCLHKECLYVGCDESYADHIGRHSQEKGEHAVTLNLTHLRVYCSSCSCEVFLENNEPPLKGMIPVSHLYSSRSPSEPDSDEEEEGNNQNLKPRGLTGLQNLGNTCYMNAAIQALSNCPPLTNFFLECGPFVRSDKKPGLSKTYMKLIKEIWHKKRPSYVVPSGIAYGIKMVFPVFRGYTQQDAQEFLRCFMDQLHEELKETIVEIDGYNSTSPESTDDFDSCSGEAALAVSEDSSQSEAEFETCDSGLSSEKSSYSEECGDVAESVIADDDDAHNSLLVSSGNMSHGNQVLKQSNNQSMQCWPPEMSKEMKDSNNFAHRQATNDERDLPGRGDSASDSGFPSNHSADILESSSFIERRSPSGLRRGERYTDYLKRNHVTFCGRQQTGTQAQSIHNSGSQNSNSKSTCKRRRPIQYRSVISDTFDGKILSSVQCLTCDTVSTTRETFQDLSLPIPNRDHLHMLHASQGSQQKGTGACSASYSHQSWLSWMFSWMLSWFWGPTVSLQDCLSAFFSADELKGDNMYSCEKCRKLRNGVKYSKVLQLPEVLCIHLKRFRHEVMFSSKISSYVSFPLEDLDLSPFLHKECPRGITTYDLAAVICHHGTAGSGHYTSYALNYLNDQWYEFDDQYVTVVDQQTVQNCEAYVLFYRKSSEEMIKKRQRAVELMERSRSEPGLLHFYISKQWVNKFNTFAEPGPITNIDFLCPHGGVPPNKACYVEELVTILSQAVWEYLHDTFGGGPSCNHLYLCPVCQAEQESLDRRRRQEYDTFVTLNREYQAQDTPPIVFGISMNWFKHWEVFVKGKENDPPLPIDNSSICYIKGNTVVLKHGSDYGSMSEEMWRFLHSIYGGGPEIILQQNITSGSLSSQQSAAGMHASTVNTIQRTPTTAVMYAARVNSSGSTKSSNSSHCHTSGVASPSSGKKIPVDHPSSSLPCDDHPVNVEAKDTEMEKEQ